MNSGAVAVVRKNLCYMLKLVSYQVKLCKRFLEHTWRSHVKAVLG